MSTTIQETIARLRELDQQASPAPWSYNPWSANSNGEVTQNITYGWGEEEEILIGEVSYLLIESDAEMIAESRNAIPVLLAEIDRLTPENTQLLDTVAEAWDEGYLDKEAEASEAMIERGLRERAQNPYKKDN